MKVYYANVDQIDENTKAVLNSNAISNKNRLFGNRESKFVASKNGKEYRFEKTETNLPVTSKTFYLPAHFESFTKRYLISMATKEAVSFEQLKTIYLKSERVFTDDAVRVHKNANIHTVTTQSEQNIENDTIKLKELYSAHKMNLRNVLIELNYFPTDHGSLRKLNFTAVFDQHNTLTTLFEIDGHKTGVAAITNLLSKQNAIDLESADCCGVSCIIT